MRPRWGVMAGLVWLSASVPCAAETLDADSKIVAVTVFPDRAAVTREIQVKLPKGSHTVRVAPVPGTIEPDSVTTRGLGEAAVTLYGVRLVTQQLETAQDPHVQAIEEEIQAVGRRQQRFRNTKRILEQERKYLSSIQAASSEQIGKDLVTKAPSASDAAALLAFLDDAFEDNFKREQEADVELEGLSRTLDRLQRELATLRQGWSKQETAILVELEAQESTAFQLQVSYRLPGATWHPSYEARASSASDEVELASSALVRQQTGEPWPDVQVTLSTAKPALSGSMPELEPWFLRPWEPRPIPLQERRAATKGAAAPEHVVSQLERAPADKKELEVAYAAVETPGPSITFKLPKPETIPSDWQPHKVPISTTRFNAAVAYETTPRLATYAFLRAKVTNTTETLYLVGPVSVFLDGAFVATATLKQIAPGETFDLYLGVDERVKVERKQLKEHVEVSLFPGLRGKTQSTNYEFLTTIENFTGRRIQVTAFDQVPVSEREEIIVESIQQIPPEVEKDSEKPGIFHWTLDLGPTQKQELRLSYRIRHPVEMQVH